MSKDEGEKIDLDGKRNSIAGGKQFIIEIKWLSIDSFETIGFGIIIGFRIISSSSRFSWAK